MDGSKPHILIVDDEIGPRESLRLILSPHYNVHVAEGGAQAVELLRRFPIDVVTLDLKMPGMTGINVLANVKQYDPDIEAIIITGYGSLETAVEGLLGSDDGLGIIRSFVESAALRSGASAQLAGATR